MEEPILHKKSFHKLMVDELYELLRVRSEVFAVETQQKSTSTLSRLILRHRSMPKGSMKA